MSVFENREAKNGAQNGNRKLKNVVSGGGNEKLWTVNYPQKELNILTGCELVLDAILVCRSCHVLYVGWKLNFEKYLNFLSH